MNPSASAFVPVAELIKRIEELETEVTQCRGSKEALQTEVSQLRGSMEALQTENTQLRGSEEALQVSAIN